MNILFWNFEPSSSVPERVYINFLQYFVHILMDRGRAPNGIGHLNDIIFMMFRFYECAGFARSSCHAGVVRLLLEICAQIFTILPMASKHVSVVMTFWGAVSGVCLAKLHVSTYRNQKHCWWFQYIIFNIIAMTLRPITMNVWSSIRRLIGPVITSVEHQRLCFYLCCFFCMSVCLSVCLFVCLFGWLPACLSVCLSVSKIMDKCVRGCSWIFMIGLE